jgi:hypothetical protein
MAAKPIRPNFPIVAATINSIDIRDGESELTFFVHPLVDSFNVSAIAEEFGTITAAPDARISRKPSKRRSSSTNTDDKQNKQFLMV